MTKVLFTGGGGAGTEALARLLSGQYDVHFADSRQDIGAITPAVKQSQQHNIPWASDQNYATGIVDLIKQIEIDVFVPTVDEELAHIAEIQALLPDLKILAPEPHYIDRFMDKQSMAEHLALKGLPNPDAYSLEELETLDFPVFAKPRLGRGSRGVQRLDSKEDVQAYLVLAKQPADAFVAQNWLVGTEYTVMMSADGDGNLCAIVPVRVDEKRGITIISETVDDHVVSAVCEQIHQAYPAQGCYNIQLMKTDDSTVVPFEINPRVSTTLCMGIAAGIDPIDNYISGKKQESLQSFKSGLVLHRYWLNHIDEK
ncbi:MAG: ATP-grasp domain-containing protein [Gammaproteobacteria bacterium]|nr:ATP-grasp domain-containing protein [Gammaproteobacteria bacterium]